MDDASAIIGGLSDAPGGMRYSVRIAGSEFAVGSAALSVHPRSGAAMMAASMDGDGAMPHLTGAMLGPSREFAEIEILAEGARRATIYANLTSYSHGASGLVLNLELRRVEWL